MLASCNPATLGGCGGIVIQETLELYLPISEANLTQNCSQTWLLKVSVEKEQGLVCQNAFSHGWLKSMLNVDLTQHYLTYTMYLVMLK